MHGRPGRRAEQVAVAVGPRLVPPVGRHDQKRGESVLQLFTDLSYGLAVATTTVIHRFTWGQRRVGSSRSLHPSPLRGGWGPLMSPRTTLHTTAPRHTRALTHKLDLPDTVWEEEAVRTKGAHLSAHLPKDRLGPIGAR